MPVEKVATTSAPLLNEPSKIPEIEITKKELEIRGSRLNSHKFPEVFKWFEKKG